MLRRSFLKGLLGTAGLVAVAPQLVLPTDDEVRRFYSIPSGKTLAPPDDATWLQQRIDEVAAAGGGVVNLTREGRTTLHLSREVVIPGAVGLHDGVLHATSGFDDSLVRMEGSNNEIMNIEMRGGGIRVGARAENSFIYGCMVSKVPGAALTLSSPNVTAWQGVS